MTATLKSIRDRCEEVGECWIWNQAVAKNGYPRGHFRGHRSAYSHIVAWEIAHECRVPDGLRVRRTCGDRLCCNPEHTTLATPKQVNRIAASAGAWKAPLRIAKITKAARARSTKLSLELARQIRASTDSADAWAERLGVDRSLIFRIRRGEAWREAVQGSSVFAANASVFTMAQGAR